MTYMLREIPKAERPRERLIKYGAMALADCELLAIILQTGTKEKSVLDVARDVTMRYEKLSDMHEATLAELRDIKGIGEAKAIALLAAIEIGRRMASIITLDTVIDSPLSTFHYLKHKMQHLTQETLICIFLNTRNQVIADKVLTMGTLDHTIFHPRDILKWALKHSAYGIILAHNHPSGSPLPSQMDINMTNQMIEAAKTMGIVFVDHIIIGHNKYYSFVAKKEIKV